MSSYGYFPDDPIFAALEALHCPPDDVADALGIDVKALWGYQFGGRTVPPYLLQRLVALLEERAACLRDVAAMLGADGRRARALAKVS